MTSIRDKIDERLADFRLVEQSVRLEAKALLQTDNELTVAEEARGILQVAAQAVQQQAHDRISSVVSRCLQTVFDDPYEFHIEFEKKRGKTEAHLQFIRGGLVLDSPMQEVGGGVIDVAAFALRLACLVLARPHRRRFLVLDEPFQKIRGKKNRERVRDLLLSLAEELDIQFVLNVDIDAYPEFALGSVIDLGVGDG